MGLACPGLRSRRTTVVRGGQGCRCVSRLLFVAVDVLIDGLPDHVGKVTVLSGGISGQPFLEVGVHPDGRERRIAHVDQRSTLFYTRVSASHSGLVFEGCDELGQVPVGDPAQLADLDAAELAGTEQVVDLVPADVQHLGDLLNCVCLQRGLTSSRVVGWSGRWHG